MKTKLVNLKDCPKRIDGGVYIGRGSIWGNPFVIGKDGDRETVIARFKRRLWADESLMDRLGELEGKTLLCFCAPEPCHGDVLLAAIAWSRKQVEEAEAKIAAFGTETGITPEEAERLERLEAREQAMEDAVEADRAMLTHSD